ncbi:ATP-binding protein [Chitinophaga rhizosphaerae]|uniref:ATP-binding protein n=1 Tax=Chitinophaga rhizosphaerae TaxID=1864947 RepID=UPI000F80F22C|nr:ATP-binding protein [Chitinophaga rhizosphaerae]
METVLIKDEFITNIAGKVRNTKLPKNKALWPLFETISNSIHAIEDNNNLKTGRITITLVRNGDQEALKDLSRVEEYAIKSFIVRDNGIGFNADNYKSFLTAESDYKFEKGAKGIGRFVCLKAFRTLKVDSYFLSEDGNMQLRAFELQPTGNGLSNPQVISTDAISTGTTVTLNHLREEYRPYVPKSMAELGERIIEHFLVYFVLEKCPVISLIDNNGKEIVLQDLYGTTIKSTIERGQFDMKNKSFSIHLVKLHDSKGGHKIHFCANEREVLDESLTKQILDLGKSIKDVNDELFTYQCYVTGSYLDKNVDSERTSFSFPTGDTDDDDDENVDDELTLKEIRKGVVDTLENMLEPYLKKIRESKFIAIKNHISDSAPQFKPIIKYKPDSIRRIQPNLTGNKLNIELFKLQSELELEVKKMSEDVLGVAKDFRDTDEYKEMYNDYIEKFNDIGKSNLASYIVHRKAVIELLDLFLGQDDDGKYQTEETIHRIFFPIKSESDEINYEQQNLWLIDERLSYHSYLSSDKSFKEIAVVEDANSLDRPDLLIFNDSFAFVNDDAPHNSIVLVEFKRPERKDYNTVDEK